MLKKKKKKETLKCTQTGTSLVVQWLRFCASTAGSIGLVSGWGTKILHGARCSQKIKAPRILK